MSKSLYQMIVTVYDCQYGIIMIDIIFARASHLSIRTFAQDMALKHDLIASQSCQSQPYMITPDKTCPEQKGFKEMTGKLHK